MKILTLDGGGIRGVIPCTILAEIERRLDRPTSQMFDLIAGTSTGGIIASGLNVPHPEQSGKPKFSAADMVELYEKNGKEIFKKRGGWLSGVNSLFDSSFSHAGLEGLLREYFGDTELRQTLTEILITSYDIEQRKPFYFLSRLAKINPEAENFLLRDIARSTSAAPTYFQPNALPWSESNRLALVDGGVFANNPSMLAYTEAVELMRQRKQTPVSAPTSTDYDASEFESFTTQVTAEKSDIFILSIGTGRIVKPYRYEDAKSWGMTQWLRPIIDILMQGVSETVDYQMQYVLPPAPDGRKQYVRLNPVIPEENSEMADVSEKNIAALKAIAQKTVEENEALIEEVCEVIRR
jgi:patatin-like phospholipase/acyl hydrolase